ncbi:MAG: hypothetical protein ACREOO_14735 [bacterium]
MSKSRRRRRSNREDPEDQHSSSCHEQRPPRRRHAGLNAAHDQVFHRAGSRSSPLRLASPKPPYWASGSRAACVQAFTGDDRYILDYLVEEVFQRQPEPVQNFLLQTSILNRLCGDLCDAVLTADFGARIAEADPVLRNPPSEIRNAQATLEHLERANLFIIPLDNMRQWYRYHHLFAELLRFRLNRSHPETTGALHRRASTWFESNGFMEEAIEHAMAQMIGIARRG